MELQLEQTLEILDRTPATLRVILEGLSADWSQTNGDRDSWSAYDVIGHLIQGEESNWMPRAEMILRDGESRSFEPFDRFAMFERSKDKSLEQLLDTFALLRRQNIAKIRAMNLTSAQLELRGTHPELGVVTLRQLLATWVVHDLNHIGQVIEAMSKRYSEAVGPWKVFLPILSR